MKRIFYIQYTDPCGYPPLEHSAEILAGRGWDVLFLGTGAFGAPGFAFAPNPRIRVFKLPFCRSRILKKAHYFLFVFSALLMALILKPRWIYASDPHAALPALVLVFLGFKVSYHEHDSPDAEPEITARRSSAAFIRKMRIKIGNKADVLVMPNLKRLDLFLTESPRDKVSFCVWNCPGRSEVRNVRLPAKKELWALYHGSIVPARLPLTVLEAMALCPATLKLKIVGYETSGAHGYLAVFMKKAQALGISERIVLEKAVPRKKLFDLSWDCDFGLAWMPKQSQDVNMGAMTGASNKPFDYLACGLALLVSDLPEWIDFYVMPGYGKACNPENAAAIAEAFLFFLKNPAMMREMGEKGRKKIQQDWNYERQFDPVLKILEGN